MTVTLDLKPEVEARLQAKAAAKGQDLKTYLQLTAEEWANTTENEAAPFWATATPEEWDRAFVAWVESHNDFPALPPEAFTREGLYGERG